MFCLKWDLVGQARHGISTPLFSSKVNAKQLHFLQFAILDSPFAACIPKGQILMRGETKI